MKQDHNCSQLKVLVGRSGSCLNYHIHSTKTVEKYLQQFRKELMNHINVKKYVLSQQCSYINILMKFIINKPNLES